MVYHKVLESTKCHVIMNFIDVMIARSTCIAERGLEKDDLLSVY